MNSKAQLKIQQMAFMLIAITIFFAIAGMFALTMSSSNNKKDAEFIREEHAMTLISKLANSPEFSCGEVFGGGQSNCIDSDKAIILAQKAIKYKTFWGVEDIEIKIINSDAEKLCNLQNYPDCNTINILNNETEGYPVSNFVSLCRKESFGGENYDKCEVARITVVTKGTW